MDYSEFGEWQDLEGAPRDGTRVLVMIRPTEQGPAEVDVARWGRPDRASPESWIATDSDHECPIVYTDAELAFWMPLPTPLPKLRTRRSEEETFGSGI